MFFGWTFLSNKLKKIVIHLVRKQESLWLKFILYERLWFLAITLQIYIELNITCNDLMLINNLPMEKSLLCPYFYQKVSQVVEHLLKNSDFACHWGWNSRIFLFHIVTLFFTFLRLCKHTVMKGSEMKLLETPWAWSQCKNVLMMRLILKVWTHVSDLFIDERFGCNYIWKINVLHLRNGF